MAGEKDDSEDSICKICKVEVKSDEKAIKCDGFCGKWIHINCSGVSVAKYKLIMQIGREVLWICNDCKVSLNDVKKYGMKNVMNACKSMNLENECSMILDISNRIKNIEEKLNRKKETVCTPKPSYAEILRRVTKDNKEVFNEGIIIKPKVADSDLDTKAIVQKLVDPAKIGVPIKALKKLKNGGIIVKTGDKEDNRKLLHEVKEKMKENFEVIEPKQRRPTLCIPRLKKDYTSEELINEIRALNHGIDKNDNLKVVHSRINRYTHKYAVFIEVNNSLYNKMVNNYINIGWETILVKEDFGVIRCYKCQGFGHKINNCTKTEYTCGNCGQNHSTSKCGSTHQECVNCKKHQNYANNCKHKCGSMLCSIMQQKVKKHMERINYNISELE